MTKDHHRESRDHKHHPMEHLPEAQQEETQTEHEHHHSENHADQHSKSVARAVTAELGIDQYFAQVLPEDKDKMVSELQHQGKRVAMVGDGVNDGPALTRAVIGIAIGSGSDVAIESAGTNLVRSTHWM